MTKNLRLIIMVTALLTTAFAKAQTSGGPDGFGYVWRNNLDVAGPAYNWVDISGRPGTVTVSGLGDDNFVGPFAITIPFHYYWYDPTNFYIGSNGYLGFTAHGVASPFPTIPATIQPNDWMAVMTSDLTFTDLSQQPVPGASCMYWQSGDSLVVTWQDVPFWDSAAALNGYEGDNTFQVILCASDSSITFQYLQQIGDISIIETSNFMEMGIENVSGNIGLEVQHDIYPLPNTAVKFYYPDTVTLAVSDAATSYVGGPGSKGIIVAKGLTTYTSVAEVKNTGNQTLPSFNSYSRVVNASNLIQVRDTVPVTNLAPTATQVITYPDIFNPTVTGRYRQINTTILAGDAAAANNVDTLELWVVDPTLANVSLQWDNGTSTGPGVSWTGGGGGLAQHFTPPYYPCNITAVGALVATDANAVGFYMLVFADDGPNGSAGTKLDSIAVPSGSFTPGTYYQASTTSALQINSGGFYVVWMMGGDQIVLAEDAGTPHSHQSWEILGDPNIPTTWAEFRDGALQDPVIHAVISGTVGMDEIAATTGKIGEFYPNPTRFKTTLQYNLKNAADMNVSIYNIQGTLVAEKNYGRVSAGDGVLELNVQNLAAGIYVCKINAGLQEFHKRINVVR